MTPLVLAAFHSDRDIARHLLLHGCNINSVCAVKLDGVQRRVTAFKCALLK